MKISSLLVIGIGVFVIANSGAYAICSPSQMATNAANCRPTPPPPSTTTNNTGTTTTANTPITNPAYDASGVYQNLKPVKGTLAAIVPQPYILASYFVGCTAVGAGIMGPCQPNTSPPPRNAVGSTNPSYPSVTIGSNGVSGSTHVGYTRALCTSGFQPVVSSHLVGFVTVDKSCTSPTYYIQTWPVAGTGGYNIYAQGIASTTNTATGATCKSSALILDFDVWCQ